MEIDADDDGYVVMEENAQTLHETVVKVMMEEDEESMMAEAAVSS
jgi:hypothetical protein